MSTHGGVLPPVVAVIELETKAMRRFAKISQAQAPSSAFTFKTLLRHYLFYLLEGKFKGWAPKCALSPFYKI